MKIALSADENPDEARALARFAAVQAVVQACQNGSSLTQALHHAAQQAWDGRFFSPATIEDWVYRYRHGQFNALQNRPRRDRGEHRALDPAALETLLKLRREYPQLTVKALTEELVRRGVLERGTFSASTLHRRLAEAGLDRQSLRAGSGLAGGPTKAFELPLPNLLWMADCMHGPVLKTEDGATQRTYLFAIIDDCSRLCVHAQFYPHERLEGFLDTLRQAVQNRGLVDKLYTDNGAAFRSQHLGIVCANLGIRLLHCKPYHSWSKGKIERWFHSCQTQFLPTLTFEPVRSFEELNRRFWRWLETAYHQREHAALSGESPAQRFARLGTSLRLLEPNVSLERLFLMRVKRRVRKDATFSLEGEFWEVSPHLRGQIVTVHFDPIAYRQVEIWLGERMIGKAIRCNKQRNSQMPSSNDYDHDAF
jgi:transposase InsO family protein